MKFRVIVQSRITTKKVKLLVEAGDKTKLKKIIWKKYDWLNKDNWKIYKIKEIN